LRSLSKGGCQKGLTTEKGPDRSALGKRENALAKIGVFGSLYQKPAKKKRRTRRKKKGGGWHTVVSRASKTSQKGNMLDHRFYLERRWERAYGKREGKRNV